MQAQNIPVGLCQCGCGRFTPIAKVTRTSKGHVKGEPTRFVVGHARQRHGQSARGAVTPTYRSWRSMQKRCFNPNGSYWKHYGGRGITVCERWRGEGGFENFLADMGERPEGRSLDRIDNDGNYEPSNCRWATPEEQTENRRPLPKHSNPKTHCKRGHEFTDENTRINSEGARVCRTCQRMHDAAHKARRGDRA